MTRRECEAKLLCLAMQMRAIYMDYNPAGDFLSVIMDADGYICVDDAYFNADKKIILDVHGEIFKTVDVKRHSDGHIRYGSHEKEGAA